MNGDVDEPADHPGTSLAWNYRADPPQRYTQNYSRYLASGGLVRPDEFLRKCLAADPSNGGDLSRLYFFWLVLDFIVKENLKGDIAELGVYKGGTATLLAILARRLGRTAYLLDTFEGFSNTDLTGIDAGISSNFTDTSLDAVRAVVGDECVRFIKGHFPESATAIPEPSSFCLVHLDCDLYAPMRDALNYFYPRLVPGGFLIVHDYSSLHWEGPERAVDEFLVGKTESALPLTDSAGSIVIRKARPPDATSSWLALKMLNSLSGEWIQARDGALSALLGAGWSKTEEWGVWGVDQIHELRIPMAEQSGSEIELAADVQAALIGLRTSQQVDVVVSGRTLVTWDFTLEKNRGVRVVHIMAPLAVATSCYAGVPIVILQFKPKWVTSPAELDPHNKDDRRLGLGLNALRLRAAVPA